MNLIKELLVLNEEDQKVPSFGDMQKAIYKVALPYFMKAQNTKGLGDLSLSVLQREADNDRFWTSSFDHAHRALEKLVADSYELDDAIDSFGEAFDEVVNNIYDYYSDRWNFDDGTKLPKLVHPGEVDGDVLANIIFDLLPGEKQKSDDRIEHRGVVNAMHKDFSKLAYQQRIGKTGKDAIAPWVDAAKQVLPQLLKGGGKIAYVSMDSDNMRVTVRLDDEKYEPIPDAKFVSKDDLNIPAQYSSVDDEDRGEYTTYTFHYKDEIPSNLEDLVDDEVRKIRRALLK